MSAGRTTTAVVRSKWSVTHGVYHLDRMGVPGESTSDATASVADTVRQALAGLDLEAVRRSYRDQNQFVCHPEAGGVDIVGGGGGVEGGLPGHAPSSRATCGRTSLSARRRSST